MQEQSARSTEIDDDRARAQAGELLAELTRVAGGRQDVCRLLLCAALAGGHVLLSDRPGSGKTTLAKAAGRLLGLGVGRVQGTADLLPSDITGVSVWRNDVAQFEFRPGPVFANILLFDEINRCPPRTQSALLEAMAERQVTTDGVVRALPVPFMVIATQNPGDNEGTAPLPDSQMDRFLFSASMGTLSGREEMALLASGGCATGQARRYDFVALQAAAARITTKTAIVDYLYALLQQTRQGGGGGLSTRAGIAILGAARAAALLAGRAYVSIDDIQFAFVPAARHRLGMADGQGAALAMLHAVPVRP